MKEDSDYIPQVYSIVLIFVLFMFGYILFWQVVMLILYAAVCWDKSLGFFFSIDI